MVTRERLADILSTQSFARDYLYLTTLQRMDWLVAETFPRIGKAESVILTTALATASLLRPLVNEKDSPLAKALPGGPAYNHHIPLDQIGADILIQKLHTEYPEATQPQLVYIEEAERWQGFGCTPVCLPDSTLVWNMDPIDGSNDICKGIPTQTVGLAVSNAKGILKGAVVANLNSKDVLFWANNKLHKAIFDEKNSSLLLKEIPQKITDVPDILNIAMVERRIPTFRQTQINHLPHRIHEGYGGTHLFGLLDGTIDVLFDLTPCKGRPWYESVIFDQFAQKAGFVVRGKDGNAVDFASILTNSFTLKAAEEYRVPLVVCRNQGIFDKIKPYLF